MMGAGSRLATVTASLLSLAAFCQSARAQAQPSYPPPQGSHPGTTSPGGQYAPAPYAPPGAGQSPPAGTPPAQYPPAEPAQHRQSPQGSGQGTWNVPQYAPRVDSQRYAGDLELGSLYGMSAAYGVALGVWFDVELDLSDPGLALIAPAVLGVGAPVGVYFWNESSRLKRGVPAAVAAGLTLGAGEGLAIAGYQYVTNDEDSSIGFRGLSRIVVMSSTLGGAAGFVAGSLQEPSPYLSALVSSGAIWGAAIGSAIGYGRSEEGVGYGRSNDTGALGGLIGYNVGIAGAAAMATAFVPTEDQLIWMWSGAGIGAAVSLPVFLFYAGDDTPPAKRGFVFTGVAMSLGIVAGGVFAPRRGSGAASSEANRLSDSPFGVRLSHFGLAPVGPRGLGFGVSGTLN